MSIAEVDEVVLGQIQLEEEKEKSEGVKVSQEDDVDETEKSEQAGPAGSSKPKTNRTVRVDIERLDTLMNLVSELIIIKNGLETVENTNQNFSDQIEYLERITTNLHDAVMKVRMVPIERVFNRFPRLIRDLS
ncbi:MAG: chemotaxis protein CheA, partial [Vallitaleaceae bacterium]|nr:chemotaxis protein CheA [Vallitaleaceae bacterium]